MSLISFTDYVSKNLDGELWEAMENYLKNANSSCFSFRFNHIRNIGEVEIQDANVISVGAFDAPETKILFDIIYEVEMYVYDDDRYHNPDAEYKKQWYYLKCDADLENGLENFNINNIEPYYSKDKKGLHMSDSLVPIINNNDLEDHAAAIVKKYYPEAIKTPMYINPIEFANKMNLRVVDTTISKEGNIFGQIHFVDGNVVVHDKERDTDKIINVKAGTILVDPDVVFHRNIGSYNNTIFHECVHWELHKKAFQLERVYNDEAVRIKCKIDGELEGHFSNSVQWMEWQANALAPRLQMPFPAFKIKAAELLREIEREIKNTNFCDAMPLLIERLAEFYCVSKMSAKIRLIDAGYEEAKGSLIFIDNHYVRPHKWKKGTLLDNQTFSISEYEALVLSLTDCELYNVTKNGEFLFLDSHFVLNDPKYVHTDAEGNKQITDYALRNMDECCLVFELKIKNTISDYYNKICFLNRDSDAYVEFEPKFVGKWKKNEKNKYIDDMVVEDQVLYNSMTNDIGICIKKCIEWAETTQKELAEECEVDKDTINRIISGSQKPEKGTLARIIFALHIPPNTSRHIFDKSPCPLQMKYNDDPWIEFALRNKYQLPFKEIISFLEEHNVKI